MIKLLIIMSSKINPNLPWNLGYPILRRKNSSCIKCSPLVAILHNFGFGRPIISSKPIWRRTDNGI